MPVTVDVLLSGELSMSHAYTFRPDGGLAKRLAALVDAHRSVSGDFGRPMGLVFGSLRPAGTPLPLLVTDKRAAADTLRRLHAFARERPDAALVPSHDPGAWRALRTSREAVAEA